MKRVRFAVFVVAGLLLTWAAGFAATDEKIPDLRPARGELLPSFWELHGWQVVIAGLGVAGVFAILAGLLKRSKTEAITPPQLAARRALEALRNRPEDGVLLVEVSQIVRRYLRFAFNLPEGELTTAELAKTLQSNPRATRELTAATMDFFHHCDERKFGPSRIEPPLGAVAGACELIDRIEIHRRRMLEPTLSQPQGAGIAKAG